jgi:hypothetical protein
MSEEVPVVLMMAETIWFVFVFVFVFVCASVCLEEDEDATPHDPSKKWRMGGC